jgi:hypothetical protein
MVGVRVVRVRQYESSEGPTWGKIQRRWVGVVEEEEVVVVIL